MFGRWKRTPCRFTGPGICPSWASGWPCRWSRWQARGQLATRRFRRFPSVRGAAARPLRGSAPRGWRVAGRRPDGADRRESADYRFSAHSPACQGVKGLPNRFPDSVVEAIRQCQVLGIRAGHAPHRVIESGRLSSTAECSSGPAVSSRAAGIARCLTSRAASSRSSGRQFAIRAVRTRSDRVKDAVSRAYVEKVQHAGRAEIPHATSAVRNRARRPPSSRQRLVPRELDRSKIAPS